MKSGSRDFASIAGVVILTPIILFACLAVFAEHAIAQGGRPTITPDTRYGEGGTKVTTRDARDRVIKEEWKDKAGRILEQTDTSYPDAKDDLDAAVTEEDRKRAREKTIVKTVETTYYRITKTGTARRTSTTKKIDRIGGEYSESTDYDESDKVIGRTVRTPDGVIRRFRLNPRTGVLEEFVPTAKSPKEQPSTPATPPATPPAAPATPLEPPSSGGGTTEEVMPVSYTPFEFYLGYSHNRVDIGEEREGFNGFATSFAGNFNRYAGLKAYYSFHTRSSEEIGLDFSSRASIHQGLGGVQFQDNAIENGPVRPFAHLLAGVAHHRFSVESPVGTFSDSRTGFAGVIGGGLDFRLNDRVSVRTQFDYNPNHIDGEWQQNVRAGVGLVFNFGRRSDDSDDADDRDDAADSLDPTVAAVPQTEAVKCKWNDYSLGKDTNVTNVKSDKPAIVEVRVKNFAGAGGFEYHCRQNRGTALITYKYTDANGGNQEGKLRVFCK